MSEERISALEQAIERLSEQGGASVRVEDPRISRVQNWILGIVGMGIIGTLGWLANSVDNLNRNFAAISQWKYDIDKRVQDLERLHERK